MYQVQKRVSVQLMKQAQQLKKEFKEYLEDLELFADKSFWKAVEEASDGKVTRYKSLSELKRKLGK